MIKLWDEKAEVVKLGDHIEMDHEKELPGMWAFATLWNMHQDMHRRGDHWNHNHIKEESKEARRRSKLPGGYSNVEDL